MATKCNGYMPLHNTARPLFYFASFLVSEGLKLRFLGHETGKGDGQGMVATYEKVPLTKTVK